MDTTAPVGRDELNETKVLVAGACSLVLTLGLARFAYTPFLTAMQNEAGLGDALAGWLATLNYAGYMAGAILAIVVKDAGLKTALYRAGLLVAVASTFGMGLTRDPVTWGLLRVAAGLSSAAGMFLGSAAVLSWLAARGRRQELGLHFAGLTLGIAVSGMLAIAAAGRLSWDGEWFAAGVLGAVLLVPAWRWMPSAVASKAPYREDGRGGSHLHDWPLAAAYFTAGAGYAVGATFLVAIIERQPGMAGHGNAAWIVTGLAGIPASALWDRLTRRIGEHVALLAAFAGQIASLLLLTVADGPVAALATAAMFGSTFIGVVSLTLSAAGRNNPANPARAMASLTLSYGVAQMLAPAAAGTIAATTGSYGGGLALSAIAMAAGMACLLLRAARAPSTKDQSAPRPRRA